MRPPLMCLALAVVFACGGKTDDATSGNQPVGSPSDDTGSDGGDDTGSEDTGGPNGDPTYYTDIAPFIQTHCARCHHSGGQGTGDLTDKDNVDAMAEIILNELAAGTMPPPVADPDCRPYQGHDHFAVDDEERDTFARWVELGQPAGDPESLVEVPPIETELSDPDMELYIPAPYTPTYSDPANPGNEYRCFVIDPGQEETFYVTALAPILDERDIIHHIVLFRKSYSEIEESELGADGYDCIGSGMADGITGLIAGWAPGGLPVIYEEGLGMPITPTDRLVLQIHYYQGGPDAIGLSDQTGYAFRTAVSVDTSVLMIPFGPTDFRIPAGDEAYTASFTFPLPYSFDVIGTFPHMHILGAGYRMWLDGEAGRQCLAESDQYDFDNQQMYIYEEPARVEQWDALTMECTWNNSTSNSDLIHDPPIDTFYGERTDEEMCFAFTLVAY